MSAAPPFYACAEWGAWVVDTRDPSRFGIVECSTARKAWVVFDPSVWPPEKRWRDQLRQMTDDEIEAWARRQEDNPTPAARPAAARDPDHDGRR